MRELPHRQAVLASHQRVRHSAVPVLLQDEPHPQPTTAQHLRQEEEVSDDLKFEFRTGRQRRTWKGYRMSINEIFIELNEDVDRIEVHFQYDEETVRLIKTVKGKRPVYENDRFKHWTVPMDMQTARRLRELFGENLNLGKALRAWAKEQVKHERNLRQLNAATDAKISTKVPKVIRDVIAGRPVEHPSIPVNHVLRRKRPPRPYQRADIAMMALANAGNFNDVGTGKTIEAIGAIYEAGIDNKPVLIVAPRRALVNVWQTEFERFSDYVILASESPGERKEMMEEIVTLAADGQKVGLAVIADDLRFEKYKDIKKDSEPTHEGPLHACRDYQGNWYKYRDERQQALYQIDWGAFIIDEFHTTGLPSRLSLFSVSANQIRAERKWPMSGTPIGGKPRRLWPILNFIDPKQYSAEWTWIDRWLEVTEDTFYKKGDRRGMPSGKARNVGGIAPGREEDFWNHHRMH